MLNFGNKEFRNLQEQVQKNANDIQQFREGVKISYAINDVIEIASLITEANVGKYILVKHPTQKLYVISRRANEELFAEDLGKYPAGTPGPQGPVGETGPEGRQGVGLKGVGTVLPSPADYRDGDFFLLNTGMIHKLELGAWVPQFSIKGPQGPIGPGGGSQVVANPYQSATDALTKIKIDGVVYDVSTLTAAEKEMLTNLVNNTEWTGSNVLFGGNISADGDISGYTITGETISGEVINASSSITAEGDITTEEDITADGNLDIHGAANVEGNLDVGGNITLTNKKISGVSDPVTDYEAANKQYVDRLHEVAIEVAKGKTTSYTIELLGQDEGLTEQYFLDGGTVKRVDGTEIDNWSDFRTYVNDGVIINNIFNTNNQYVPTDGGYGYILTINNIVIPMGETISKIKDGDILFIIDSDIPDRWFFKESAQTEGWYAFNADRPDLSNMVTTDTDQTITGIKVFTGATTQFREDVSIGGDGDIAGDLRVTGDVDAANLVTLADDQSISGEKTYSATQTFRMGLTCGDGQQVSSGIAAALILRGIYSISKLYTDGSNRLCIDAYGNNQIKIDSGGLDLGSKRLKTSGNITDGTNSASVADLTNSLLGMDVPTSTILTDEQIAKIVKGGVVLKGSFSGFESLILLKPRDTGTGYYTGIFISNNAIGQYNINQTAKTIYFFSESSEVAIRLRSISHINGKAIPGYPSSTGTFVLKCIDGVLTWVEE